jgi:hypothetical protein
VPSQEEYAILHIHRDYLTQHYANAITDQLATTTIVGWGECHHYAHAGR